MGIKMTYLDYTWEKREQMIRNILSRKYATH